MNCCSYVSYLLFRKPGVLGSGSHTAKQGQQQMAQVLIKQRAVFASTRFGSGDGLPLL